MISPQVNNTIIRDFFQLFGDYPNHFLLKIGDFPNHFSVKIGDYPNHFCLSRLKII